MDTENNWNFNEPYLWSKDFTECSSLEQSPINIDTENLTQCKLLCQLDTDIKSSKCRINYSINNKISLEYDYGSFIKFNNKYYGVNEISIHTPSLHAIDNEYFDMEIIIICKSDQSGNEDSADNGIIISRLFNRFGKEYGDGNDFLSAFINKIPRNPINYNKIVDVNPKWTADLLIPKDKTSFFLYNGSLPFPPCNEKYSVVIYEKIENISDSNYEIIKQNVGENNRPLQIKNNRKVFYSSGKVIEVKNNIVSNDRFLKCSKIDTPKPTTTSIINTNTKNKNVWVDTALGENSINRIRIIFFAITMISILLLSFLTVKYLFKTFKLQKVLQVIIPQKILTEEMFNKWKSCKNKPILNNNNVINPTVTKKSGFSEKPIEGQQLSEKPKFYQGQQLAEKPKFYQGQQLAEKPKFYQGQQFPKFNKYSKEKNTPSFPKLPIIPKANSN